MTSGPEWTNADEFDEVTCPACGQKWGDLWDYEWHNETIEVECPHCDADLLLRQEITVTYEVALNQKEK